MSKQSSITMSGEDLIKIFGCHYSVCTFNNHFNINPDQAEFIRQHGHSTRLIQEIGKLNNWSSSSCEVLTYEEGVKKYKDIIQKNSIEERDLYIAQKTTLRGRYSMLKYHLNMTTPKRKELIDFKLQRLAAIDQLLSKDIEVVYIPLSGIYTIPKEYPKVDEVYYMVNIHRYKDLEIVPLTVTTVHIDDNREIQNGDAELNAYDFLMSAYLYSADTQETIYLKEQEVLNFNGDYYCDDSKFEYFFKDKEKAKAFVLAQIEERMTNMEEQKIKALKY